MESIINFLNYQIRRAIVRPTRSAYKEALGQEPTTNHSYNLKFGAFTGCLDYIFVSPLWKVEGVKPLPSTEELVNSGYLPSKDEPSDHLMLAAELSLPTK